MKQIALLLIALVFSLLSFAQVDLGGDIFACDSESVILDATPSTVEKAIYQWYSNGVIIEGATSSTLTVVNSGEYSVIVTLANDPDNPIEDSIVVSISSFHVNQLTPLEVCDGDASPDGFTVIDLSVKNDEIREGDENLEITYHSNINDAITGVNSIPELFINTNTPIDIIYVRVVNILTGCFTTTMLNINILISPIVNRDTQNINACDRDLDGNANFDLTEVIAPIINGLTGVLITFHDSFDDAQSNTNAITDETNYEYTNAFLEPGSATLYLRIEDNITGCASVIPFEIHTNLLLTGTNLGGFEICDDNADSTDSSNFNLFIVENSIANDLTVNNGLSNNIEVTFYRTIEDRQIGIPIDKSTPFSALNAQVVYIKIDDGECAEETEITLVIQPVLWFNSETPFSYCDSDNDGVETIDLRLLDDILTKGDVNFKVSYFSSLSDGESNINQLPSTYTMLSNQEILYVRLSSSNFGCATVSPIDLILVDCQDEDNDGVINSDEDINGNGNLEDDDTDLDTIPDYLDDDDDGDKINTADELIDQNSITEKAFRSSKIARTFIDTDDDTIENYLDGDDDEDGVLTKDEDYNNNGTPLDDDTNNNNVPDYLEKEVALGVNDLEISIFSISPNPAINTVELKFNRISGNRVNTSIYDIQGKLVFNSKNEVQNNAFQLNISSLKSGLYFIKINDGTNEGIEKLVKK